MVQETATVSLSLTDCPVEDGLRMMAAKTEVGVVVLCKSPEPRLTITIQDQPAGVAFARLAEAAGYADIQEGGLHLFTTPERAAYYPRFSQHQLDPGSPTISLDFSRTDIRDLARLVAAHTGTTIALEKSLRGNLTVRVRDAPWRLLVHALAAAVGADSRFVRNTVLLAPRGRIEALLEAFARPSTSSGSISLDVRDMDMRDVGALIARFFSHGFLAEGRVRGNVTLKLLDLAESEAMGLLARSQGFAVEFVEGTWVLADPRKIARLRNQAARLPPFPGSRPISLSFRDTSLVQVLQVVAMQTGIELRATPGLEDRITIDILDRPPEEVFRLICAAHDLTYEIEAQRVTVRAPNGDGRSLRAPETVLPASPAVEPSTGPDPTSTSPTALLPETPPTTQPPLPAATEEPTSPRPLEIDILGVLGNQGLRVALARVDGKVLLLKTGDTCQGLFQVLEILPDRVVVDSFAERRRRVFPLAR